MELTGSSSIDTPRPDHNWTPRLPLSFQSARPPPSESSSLPSLPPIQNLRIAKAIWLKIEEGLANGDPRVLKITQQLEQTFKPDVANINSFQQPPSTPVLPIGRAPPLNTATMNPASVVMIAERSRALELNGAGNMTGRYVIARVLLFSLMVVGTVPSYMFGPSVRHAIQRSSKYCQKSFAPSFFLRSPTPDVHLVAHGAATACSRSSLRNLVMMSVLNAVFEHTLSGALLMYRHKLPAKALISLGLLARGLGLIAMLFLNGWTHLSLPKELTLLLVSLGGEPIFILILTEATRLVNVLKSSEQSSLETILEGASGTEDAGRCFRPKTRDSVVVIEAEDAPFDAAPLAVVTPSLKPLQITTTLLAVRWTMAGLFITVLDFTQEDILRNIAMFCFALSGIPILLSHIGWNRASVHHKGLAGSGDSPDIGTVRRRFWKDYFGTSAASGALATGRCSAFVTPDFVSSARIMMSYRGIVICLSAIAASIHLTVAVTLLRSASDARLVVLLMLLVILPIATILLAVRMSVGLSVATPLVLLVVKHIPHFHRHHDHLLIVTAAAALSSICVNHSYFVTKSLIKDHQACVNYTPFYGFVLLISGISAANAYYLIAYKAYDFQYALLAVITMLPMLLRKFTKRCCS